ncbi:CesT family type III secretion system chaperone [Pseudomonas sp. p50(2008)]|uniref:CesT family type III secretion system chaperone n=1 Tax=Pseudomonas sp. p50(2008) TaxID=2816832 RepID=UPI00188CD7BD|nr:CesT family type III secretion system chaperone [Pseudomonas sp. p50(2008)]
MDMTPAGLLVREICEYLNVDVHSSDLGVVLIEKDGQQWRIDAAEIGQRLIISSDLTTLELEGFAADYYLSMNANLELMRGAWIGLGLDKVLRLYHQESLQGLIAPQVVKILERLVGLHRHIIENKI